MNTFCMWTEWDIGHSEWEGDSIERNSKTKSKS